MGALKNINTSKGFTLAEVLITLGIIGVVAAMTIPNLVKDYQKSQTVSQLKKIYTTLAQATKLSEIVNGENTTWDWGDGSGTLTTRQSFDTYWAPFLKLTKYCLTFSDCNYTSAYPWRYASGVTVWLYAVDPNTMTSVILSDGTILVVRNDKNIYIDINAAKTPNIVGKDIFIFGIDAQKGFVPAGYSQNLATINMHCSKNNGEYSDFCSTKIILDGWQMSSDYPW